MHPTEEVLKARVGSEWFQPWIPLQVHQHGRPLSAFLIEVLECLVLLARASMRHRPQQRGTCCQQRCASVYPYSIGDPVGHLASTSSCSRRRRSRPSFGPNPRRHRGSGADADKQNAREDDGPEEADEEAAIVLSEGEGLLGAFTGHSRRRSSAGVGTRLRRSAPWTRRSVRRRRSANLRTRRCGRRCRCLRGRYWCR
jgi:hypothetical protein